MLCLLATSGMTDIAADVSNLDEPGISDSPKLKGFRKRWRAASSAAAGSQCSSPQTVGDRAQEETDDPCGTGHIFGDPDVADNWSYIPETVSDFDGEHFEPMDYNSFFG